MRDACPPMSTQTRSQPVADRSGHVIPLFGRQMSEDATEVRFALVGTYAPRKCGIATFTTDVREQLGHFHPDMACDIYALDERGSGIAYPGCETIAADDPDSYARAARRINESGVDAVWVQHEFGIFGGADGEMVCDFVDRIAAPLIFTFHTVLSQPSNRQRAIIRHLITRASRIMVMSAHGRDLLIQLYRADPALITIIAHGAPDRPFGRETLFKEALGLGGAKVLMTFGLLGPGKGLERVIEAMPAIVARHPDTVYRIVGATHPNLVAHDGEAYRESLKALASRLGVEAHIQWEDRFLDTPELLDQLEACDIYVTPYGNLQQSTSGTLSYAVALGKAVVSTPYVHARELLADGVGTLIDPASSEQLAGAINALLDDPEALFAMKRRAYERGRETIWPAFARASADLVKSVIGPAPRDVPITAQPGLSAVFAMSDGTGMLQHSIGVVPDRRHGYCLDDNVRALMLINVAQGTAPDERRARSAVYASFVQHAWNPDLGRFRNFMHFDRRWAEDVGSEDSNGRTLWALGHTIERAPDAEMRRWASGWFDQAASHLATLSSPRAVAFTMLGAAALLRRMGDHNDAMVILDRGGDLLDRLLHRQRRPDWAWFETVLGYDNPRLPQALIEAGALMGRADWTAAGVETLEWIAERQIAATGVFRPVGSESFGKPFAQLPFDQQPLEAQAAVEAAATAHRVTHDQRWIDHALAAYRWYFGVNDRKVALADLASGGCYDGVTPRGVNENRGAESILAFQLAHYALTALCRPRACQPGTGEVIDRRTQAFGQSA